MIREIQVNSEEELVVALHALEVLREVNRAARGAAPGQGLMATEIALHEKGDEFLRGILQRAVEQQGGIKKKGVRA